MGKLIVRFSDWGGQEKPPGLRFTSGKKNGDLEMKWDAQLCNCIGCGVVAGIGWDVYTGNDPTCAPSVNSTVERLWDQPPQVVSHNTYMSCTSVTTGFDPSKPTRA